jgi:hypothetical protein
MLFSLLECRRPNYWHDDQYGWWLDRDVIKNQGRIAAV